MIEEGKECHQQISQVYPSPIETLDKRTKGQHLSDSERWMIYKLVQIDKIESGCIMERFKLSYSTIRSIIKEFSSENYNGRRSLNKHATKIFQSKVVHDLIKEYVFNITYPYWIKDIIKQVAKMQRIQLQYHQLRNYMKNHLSLSNKKGGNRPWILNIKKQKPLKELYAVRLIEAMRDGKNIINIDESCLNKKTRIGYSLFSKGENWYW